METGCTFLVVQKVDLHRHTRAARARRSANMLSANIWRKTKVGLVKVVSWIIDHSHIYRSILFLPTRFPWPWRPCGGSGSGSRGARGPPETVAFAVLFFMHCRHIKQNLSPILSSYLVSTSFFMTGILLLVWLFVSVWFIVLCVCVCYCRVVDYGAHTP